MVLKGNCNCFTIVENYILDQIKVNSIILPVWLTYFLKFLRLDKVELANKTACRQG